MTRTAAPTPIQVANRARRALRARADAATARQGRTYFKAGDTVTLLGVRTPLVRSVERELYADIRGRWEVGHAIACCERLVRWPELESKQLGVILLGRFRRTFPRRLFGETQRWLDQDLLPNWAAVDAFAPTVLTPLIERYRDLLPRLHRWGRARNPWRRRAAVVTLVPLARHGRYLDEAYALVADLLGDGEDLMHKACGWLLREAGKSDRARLEKFLLDHGPAVPRTTVRYAIERFPAARRKQVLERTRG